MFSDEAFDGRGNSDKNEGGADGMVREALDGVGKQRQRLVIVETVELIKDDECRSLHALKVVAHIIGP